MTDQKTVRIVTHFVPKELAPALTDIVAATMFEEMVPYPGFRLRCDAAGMLHHEPDPDAWANGYTLP